MSTNYYACIIPSEKKKKELYNAIETNNFDLISALYNKMYSRIDIDFETSTIVGGRVHLGKRSSGWKFLWNPNVFIIRHGHTEWKEIPGGRSGHWVPEPSTLKYFYPLTKKGLKEFIDREDVLIYDEYDELQDKEEFWKMALEWGYEKDNEGLDSASYEKKRYSSYPVTGELTDLLKKEGYKFTSCTNSDFYSDGLRFAGFTEFS